MSHIHSTRRKVTRFVFLFGGITLVFGLSAVVKPKLADNRDAEVNEALAGCNRLAAALRNYTDDTEYPPCGFQGNGSYGFLRGDGAEPTFIQQPAGWAGKLEWFLRLNHMAGARWTGPYINDIPPDPWRRQYIILTDAYWRKTTEILRVWALSAGPNGIVETTSADHVLQGDDIGIVFE